MKIFADRKEAGLLLAEKLIKYRGDSNALILAIPRGGVNIGYEISKRLDLPLDIIVVKKLGAPGNEELAIGATGADDYLLNEDIVAMININKNYIDALVEIKQAEVKKIMISLRGDKPMYRIQGRNLLVIDDGVATGATMNMAIRLLRKQNPAKIAVALPIAPEYIKSQLNKVADEVMILRQPEHFEAVGHFYKSFPQLDTIDVRSMLDERDN